MSFGHLVNQIIDRRTRTQGGILTATSQLPPTALGKRTAVNSAAATVQTLPPAAAAFAASPYGVVTLVQLGTGAPTFAAGPGDTLRATAGIAASVQYAAIRARVISSTEWALA